MRNILNIKILISLVVGLFAIFLFLIGRFGFYDLADTTGFFRAYSFALTITTLVVAIFLWKGWKIPIFQGWLVLVPNLNGTWEGELQSSWIDPKTKKGIGPITTIVTVKQTLFGMSCVTRTGEMTSYSVSAGVERDQNEHVQKLIYTYRSEPKPGVADRSAMHHGTAILEFTKKPEWRLEGRYFTERSTTGEMSLAYRNRYSDTLLEAREKVHPMDKSTS